MPMGPEADALRLRRALRDLVALSVVPAVWVGREPTAIAGGLATCWSIHCTSTSLLCVCAIPMGTPRSKSRGEAHGKHFPNGCSVISRSMAACRAGKSSAILVVARSDAYLAEAQRLSHTGSFGWDVSSGKLYWSEETFRIFECPWPISRQ
jgi:hypothetical protein